MNHETYDEYFLLLFFNYSSLNGITMGSAACGFPLIDHEIGVTSCILATYFSPCMLTLAYQFMTFRANIFV